MKYQFLPSRLLAELNFYVSIHLNIEQRPREAGVWRQQTLNSFCFRDPASSAKLSWPTNQNENMNHTQILFYYLVIVSTM